MNKKTLHTLSAALLAGFAGAASAASYNWSFTSAATTEDYVIPGFASAVKEYAGLTYVNADSKSVTMNAYANTASSSKIEGAYLNYQGSSGLGVTSRDSSSNDEVKSDGTLNSPQHSFDNMGAVESILFSFESAFKLEVLDIGWSQSDSDFTVYAYTGDLADYSTSTFLGKDYSTLTGWTKVGDYPGSTDPRDVSSDTYSRYWLVTPGSTTDTTTDYIKLAGIGGSYKPASTTPTVPEPASLALIGTALAGMFAVRRRKQV